MCWVTAKFHVDIKFPGYSDMHSDIQLFISKFLEVPLLRQGNGKEFIIEPRHEKMCLRESPTRQDKNSPAQLQRPARILKFRIYKLEVSFCLGSEQQRR